MEVETKRISLEREQTEHKEWSELGTETMIQYSFLLFYSPLFSIMFRIFVSVFIMLSMK